MFIEDRVYNPNLSVLFDNDVEDQDEPNEHPVVSNKRSTNHKRETSDVVMSCCMHTFFILFLITLAVVQITVGTYNFNNCEIQNMIPVWLVVAGCLAFYPLLNHFNWISQACIHMSRRIRTTFFYNFLTSFIFVFSFTWFILGHVWIYPIVNIVQFSNLKNSSSLYCEKLTYQVAFWSLTSYYIYCVLVCLIIILVSFVRLIASCINFLCLKSN